MLDEEPEFSDFKTIEKELKRDIVESFGDKFIAKTLQVFTLFYMY